MRTGVGVARLHTSSLCGGTESQLTDIELTDRALLQAEAALVAVGSSPAADWFRGSPLDVSDGVVCDAYCAAAAEVWAAGDVASWYHGGMKRQLRLEHRINATEQARAVAVNILGAHAQFTPSPYFWTDQYDVKVQVYGAVGGDEETSTMRPLGRNTVVVEHRERDTGTLAGIVAWNAPSFIQQYQAEIDAHLVHLTPA